MPRTGSGGRRFFFVWKSGHTFRVSSHTRAAPGHFDRRTVIWYYVIYYSVQFANGTRYVLLPESRIMCARSSERGVGGSYRPIPSNENVRVTSADEAE